jgi:S1-C subfamily serine protease
VRALTACSLVLAVVALSGRLAAAPLEELIAKARGSVVHVSERDASNKELGNGSGFVISEDGKLATNYHVIEDAGRLTAVFSGGREVAVAGVWAVDPAADLAILQLDRGSYQSLRLAAAPAKQGASVVMIGSPLGLEGTVSTGIVSAVRERGPERRVVGEDLSSWGLQITAPMSPGSSGSPVLDENGEVVGVAVGQRTRGQSLNFAIPASYLRDLKDKAERASAVVPLTTAGHGRSLVDNLIISAAALTLAMLVWWLVSRRTSKPRKRSLERYGL